MSEPTPQTPTCSGADQCPRVVVALRDIADLIDRGPAIPLPPSVYSALIRERADDIEEAGSNG